MAWAGLGGHPLPPANRYQVAVFGMMIAHSTIKPIAGTGVLQSVRNYGQRTLLEKGNVKMVTFCGFSICSFFVGSFSNSMFCLVS